jgi:VIT1/CCC1 family predicted Fe2+/Mn2+ transporter
MLLGILYKMDAYLSEFIYGSIDGIITTFSIIAGSTGGGLGRNVIIILGLSNVLSDGYSMGVSRYLSAVAEQQQGLTTSKKPPLFSGLITFFSFVGVGMVPILPFMTRFARETANRVSLGMALLSFLSIGLIKGVVISSARPLQSGIQSLFVGLSAALISYGVGKYVGHA